MFISEDENDVTGVLEAALHKVIQADPVDKRLRAANLVKPDLVSYREWLDQLLGQGAISDEEAAILEQAQLATRAVIMVDEFEPRVLESGAMPRNQAA